MTPDFMAALRGVFLQGFAAEWPIGVKVLSAIPDANHDYRPDPKSKTAMELAWHIANVDIWFLDSIAALNFPMEEKPMPASLQSGKDIAAWYEPAVKESIAKVEAMTPEQLATPIDFYGMFNFPAVFYLQFLNNHHIHHRGQLSTYLRPMGGKCPGIYGGSADEPMGA
jgi:uncharacterized damage-inducible protein DinB